MTSTVNPESGRPESPAVSRRCWRAVRTTFVAYTVVGFAELGAVVALALAGRGDDLTGFIWGRSAALPASALAALLLTSLGRVWGVLWVRGGGPALHMLCVRRKTIVGSRPGVGRGPGIGAARGGTGPPQPRSDTPDRA